MGLSNFRLVMEGVNPAPLLRQIAEHPDLWGMLDTWTDGKPHSVISQMGMARSYIELRYNKSPAGTSPHPRNWNRPAFHVLTEAHRLVFDLMAAVRGEILGRIVISRMRPGEVIAPHRHLVEFDQPKIFDTFQIPLQSDHGVVFGCGEEDIHMEPGTAWTFDNQTMHWVRNGSARDRISMMLDIRAFQPITRG